MVDKTPHGAVRSRRSHLRRSGSEKLQEPRVIAHGQRTTFENNPSSIENVSVVRQAQGEFDMLLDNNNGDIFGELSQPLGNLVYDADPHALRRFIEKQELGV